MWVLGNVIESRYKILRIIDEGGMGTVYICRDIGSSKRSLLAVKTFKHNFTKERNLTERFFYEAETWIKLGKHQNIVKALFVKNINYQPYIFLEYISGNKKIGSNLGGWIEKGRLNQELILNFAIQFCNGIIYAQERFQEMGRSFMHRDIKPSNILITRNNILKITDFGLVKTFLIESSDQINPNFNNQLTQIGDKPGTPAYMSPEQIRGEMNIDIRSDIYSFGRVLFVMKNGFSRRTDNNMGQSNPPNFNPDINQALNNIINKCLEEKRENRYFDFYNLKEELLSLYKSVYVDYKIHDANEKFKTWEYNNSGASLISIGKFEEAVEELKKVLEVNPNFAEAWYNAGVAFAQAERFDESIILFGKALELNSERAEFWNDLGNAFEQKGKNDEALMCSEIALKLAPKFIEAWNNRGNILFSQGQLDEAIRCYEKVIELDPSHAEAWNNKGFALFELGRLSESLFYFTKALKINLNYIEALHNKGTVLLELGKPKRALPFFNKVLRYEPLYLKSIYNQGTAYFEINQLDEAMLCFDKVIEIDPQYFLALYQKGNIYYSLNYFSDALDCYNKVLVINSIFAPAWHNRSSTQFLMGDFDDALNSLDKEIEITPESIGKWTPMSRQIF